MSMQRNSRSGFTIVELLIVIVVIGILAAITIVSFNGVTNRAKLAAAQSDLANSNKQLEIARNTGGSNIYPTAIDCSATPATNTICLKPSNGASFTYYANSTTSPTAYCITETNGASTYYTSTSQPTTTTGSCQTVTNLAVNPNLESSLTAWGGYNGYSTVVGGNASADYTQPNDGGAFGNGYQRMKWTVATTDGVGGSYAYSNATVAGQAYTISGYVRSNKTRTLNLAVEWYNSSNGSVAALPKSSSGDIVIPANTWTRLSFTTPAAPATTAKGTVTFYGTTASTPFAVGDTLDTDGLMVSAGPTLYSFADGSTNTWSWSGTAGNSSSNGIGM